MTKAIQYFNVGVYSRFILLYSGARIADGDLAGVPGRHGRSHGRDSGACQKDGTDDGYGQRHDNGMSRHSSVNDSPLILAKDVKRAQENEGEYI